MNAATIAKPNAESRRLDVTKLFVLP